SLLRLVIHLHRVAIAHAADGVVRTGDDLVARLQAAQHLEAFVPGNAKLDRHELGLVAAEHEDAFRFLARLSRLQLLGRGNRFDRRTPALVDFRLTDDLSVGVVDQFADRDRRNRDRDDVLARRRGDVGSAGESGPHVRDLFVEHDDDLEVRGLRAGGDLLTVRRLNRAVADFGDVSLERFVLNGVDRNLRDLADLDVGHVRLVDFNLRLDHVHVGEFEQHGPGVVHRADDRGFALLHVPPRDDAVDRRFHADAAQVVARAVETGALLRDAALLRFDQLLAFLDVRLRRVDVVHRFVERFARRQLLTPEILLPRE